MIIKLMVTENNEIRIWIENEPKIQKKKIKICHKLIVNHCETGHFQIQLLQEMMS